MEKKNSYLPRLVFPILLPPPLSPWSRQHPLPPPSPPSPLPSGAAPVSSTWPLHPRRST
ncbi:hypothetical protein TIFTF001_029383 [Ficus carica]|uniref:Uncharacterized protein n=1 Tax=Ficus carica TaxID=3494 RepID=A0AA88J1G7_FICCA|nr:hypothetical protein TIFTF001_029383 [Ficus carica]